MTKELFVYLILKFDPFTFQVQICAGLNARPRVAALTAVIYTVPERFHLSNVSIRYGPVSDPVPLLPGAGKKRPRILAGGVALSFSVSA